MPPASGDPAHNAHWRDIDFQIEADFIGLMTPGMPNAARALADRVGHIMNSGDGWYGGVFVAAMYSLAFVHDDVHTVVTKARRNACWIASTLPNKAWFGSKACLNTQACKNSTANN